MHSSRILPILVAGLAVLLASCGAATVEDVAPLKPGAPTDGLTITTSRLPDGQVEGAYPVTQLVAEGGDGPVAWTLSDGTLPPGVDLSVGGILSGSPAGDNHTAMAVEVIDILPSPGGTIHVTVFGESGGLVGQLTLPALDEKQFVGILTGGELTIGRVNLWDDLGQSSQGAEGISSIEVYTHYLP